MNETSKQYNADLKNVFNHLEKIAENAGFHSPIRQKVCTDIWESTTPTLVKLEKAVKFLQRRFQEQGMEKFLEDSICKQVFENVLWQHRWVKDIVVLANGEEIYN